jgi:hypothetical protein
LPVFSIADGGGVFARAVSAFERAGLHAGKEGGVTVETSKAGWQLKRAMKRRTRKWRRRQVVLFYLSTLLWLSISLGGDHHGWRHFFWAVNMIVMAWGVGTQWFRAQRRIVQGLDDWAQATYGVNFDQLSETEQGEILQKKNLLAHRLLDSEWRTDERQEAFRLQAKDAAYRILRTTLPWFLAVYWALYLWVPAGNVRDAVMDAPIMVSWLAVFVVTLPSVIEMWTEPDEVGEARVV